MPERVRIFICMPKNPISSTNDVEDLIIITALNINGLKDQLIERVRPSRHMYQKYDENSGEFVDYEPEEFLQLWDIREFSAPHLSMLGFWKVKNLPCPQELDV